MDALAALEDTQSGLCAHKTIDFAMGDAVFSTQQLDTQTQVQNDEEDEDDNDVYDLHQSRMIAEQFEMSDDVNDESNTLTTDTTAQTTTFQNAIQKAKRRMEQLKEKNDTTTTQVIHTQKIDIEPIQPLETQPLETQPVDDINIDKEEQPSSPVPTQSAPAEDDEEEDDDEIVRPTRRHKLSSDDEDEDEQQKPFEDDQLQAETQIISNMPDDGDDDDDDEIIRPTQKHTAPAVNTNEDEEDDDDEKINTKPTTQLNSLFVSDDDDDDDDNANKSEDELSSKIENYHSMTREQRFLARKLERSKLRTQQRTNDDDDKIDDGDEIISGSYKRIKTGSRELGKHAEEKKKKGEIIRQNELIKLAIKNDPIIQPTKFSKNKLLGELKLDSDSENENDSKNDRDTPVSETEIKTTPPTSPQKDEKKATITNLLKSKSKTTTKHFVDLGSESDSDHADDVFLGNENDDEDADSDANISINKKTKMLDVKLFFSKKKKTQMEKKKKVTLSDKIRKINARQLKNKQTAKAAAQIQPENSVLTDDMLEKMLLNEQMKNSKFRDKHLKEETRRKKEKDMLRKGQFPSHDDDDPEFSDYSSDFELPSDVESIADDDNSDVAIPSRKLEQIDDDDDLDEQPIVSTQNVQESADGVVGSFKFGNGDALKDFQSFSQLFDKTQTQKDVGLTEMEKIMKMRGELPEAEPSISETQDDSTLVNGKAVMNQASFLRKQLQEQDDDYDNDHHSKSEEINDEISSNLKNVLDSQNMILATQADNLSMSTQKMDDVATQKLDNVYSTQALSLGDSVTQRTQIPQSTQVAEEDEEDDDDNDEKIQVGRKSKIQEDTDDELSYEEEEETEEVRLQRAEMIKLAKKQERELRRKREKEFKSKGLGEIMEAEAVESDDEYHGVGGADRDVSDEEDSEDEKLIDDASNIQIDENEIRRIQLEKELKEDQEKVSKTYKDIKTHKLGERRAKDGVYAVDLSDDEDENDEMLRYREYIRRLKVKERQEYMRMNKHKLAANDPKKPFFDAMDVQLPSHVSIQRDSYFDTLSELISDDEEDTNKENKDDLERPALKKRRTNKHSFENDTDLRFSSFRDQELERLRDDLDITDGDDDDLDGAKELKRLKKRTSVKITRKLNAPKVPQPRARTNDTGFDNLDPLGVLSSKSNSVTQSFKKATEKKVRISANTGNIIRDVNVTTSAKTVTNSKAAVTKLASTDSFESSFSSSRIIKGSGVDRLDKMLAKSRKLGIKKVGKGI